MCISTVSILNLQDNSSKEGKMLENWGLLTPLYFWCTDHLNWVWSYVFEHRLEHLVFSNLWCFIILHILHDSMWIHYRVLYAHYKRRNELRLSFWPNLLSLMDLGAKRLLWRSETRKNPHTAEKKYIFCNKEKPHVMTLMRAVVIELWYDTVQYLSCLMWCTWLRHSLITVICFCTIIISQNIVGALKSICVFVENSIVLWKCGR